MRTREGAPQARGAHAAGLLARGLGLAIAAVLVLSQAALAAGSWSIVPSANRTVTTTKTTTVVHDDRLNAVSCPTATACTAVGFDQGGSDPTQTLIEQLSGGAWTITPSPDTSAKNSDALGGVSCPSTSFCMAVGSYHDTASRPLALEWNGTAWAVQKPPEPTGATSSVLNAVSCPDQLFCMAAGQYVDATTNTLHTLIEQWNGVTSAWTIVASYNRGLGSDSLNGISCTSPVFCVAVGSSYDDRASSQYTLAESWDGVQWTASPALSTSSTTNTLAAVSCLSPTPTSNSCMAVGTWSAQQLLGEVYDGTQWTLEVPVASGGQFFGVSCTSSTFCAAAGDHTAPPVNSATLVRHWNGTAWTLSDSQAVGAAGSDALLGASCAAATSCVAAGYYVADSGHVATLVEQWDGSSWSVVSSPNRSVTTTTTTTTSINEFSGISCVGPAFCVAVGDDQASSPETPLIEQWDGTQWTIAPPASPAPLTDSYLAAVSCASPTFCLAVGASGSQPLVERSDGTTWTILQQPAGSANRTGVLSGVSCPSATFCMATGTDTTAGQQPLMEKWDGTSLAPVSAPPSDPTDFDNLAAVSCSSTAFCMAVGYALTSSFTFHTLAEQWDGSAWTLSHLQEPPSAQFVVLAGVSCPTPTFCMASGTNGQSAGNEPLVERWDGTSWSIIASPSSSPADGASLGAISCPDPTFCAAVGSDTPGGGTTQPFSETWDGTAWSVVAAPAPDGSTRAALAGVSCSSAAFCMAGGNNHDPQGDETTLAETFSTGPPPNLPESGSLFALIVVGGGAAGLSAVWLRRRRRAGLEGFAQPV